MWMANQAQLKFLHQKCRYLNFSESTTNGHVETHSGSLQMFSPACGLTKVSSLGYHSSGALPLCLAPALDYLQILGEGCATRFVFRQLQFLRRMAWCSLVYLSSLPSLIPAGILLYHTSMKSMGSVML